MKRMPKLMMLLKERSRSPRMDYGHDEDEYGPEYEDETSGFDQEGKRIAAMDLVQSIRSGDEKGVMTALESFISCCKH